MSCNSKSSRLERCGSPTTSNCVKYVGAEIDCIGLCSGIAMTDVVEILGNELCDINTAINLQSINIPDCFEIDEVTFVNLFEAILNKTCSIQTQINTINDALADFNPIVPNLNLACLSDSPCFTSNPTLTELFQLLISEICNLKATVAAQEAVIANNSAGIVSLGLQLNTANANIACLSVKLTNLVNYINTTVYPGSFNPTC